MDKQLILFLILTILIIYLIKNNKNEVMMIESVIDGREYIVNNYEDSEDAADLLAQIRTNIFKITDHLANNIDKYKKYSKYINLLNTRIRDVIIKEKTEKNNYTSYSVNKGEEIIFCLRSKRDNTLHDLNLIMYVALHEISHVACPEVGHTELFKDIFRFILKVGINIGIYEFTDYGNDIREYCGIYINETI